MDAAVVQAPHNQVRYSLTGDSTALEYFMVDASTGHVSLKKSVVLDPAKKTQYSVSRDRINLATCPMVV